MGISNLIESIEKLFYNFLMLIVLLPKTILNLYIPKWSAKYIDAQFQLPDENRFKDNVSPVILFIILVTVPIYYSLNYGTFFGPLDKNRNDFLSLIATNSKMPIVDKFLIISLLFSIYPVLFSVIICLHKKQSLNKDTFKKGYYSFLYTFCAVYAAFLFLFRSFFISDQFWFEPFLIFPAGILFIWANICAFISNLSILKNILNISTWRAVIYVVMVYIIVSIIYTYLITGVLEVILAHFVD